MKRKFLEEEEGESEGKDKPKVRKNYIDKKERKDEQAGRG